MPSPRSPFKGSGSSDIFAKSLPELKTEEGYSADIVPTYIPREMLCGYSADIVRTLCGHCADIVRTYISRDICPHNVRTISFFGFQLWKNTIITSFAYRNNCACGSLRKESFTKQVLRGTTIETDKLTCQTQYPPIKGTIKLFFIYFRRGFRVSVRGGGGGGAPSPTPLKPRLKFDR